MLMPFGKHAGKRLCEIPGNYLRWCVRKLRDLDPALRKAMNAELRRRGFVAQSAAAGRREAHDKARRLPPVLTPAEAEAQLVEALVEAERRGDLLPGRGADLVWRLLAMTLNAAEAAGRGQRAAHQAAAEDPGGPRLLVELARRASAN